MSLPASLEAPEAVLVPDGARRDGAYVARLHLPAGLRPQGVSGPSVVVVRGEELLLLPDVATMSDLLDQPDVLDIVSTPGLRCVGTVDDALRNSHHTRRAPDQPYFLAPTDLQVLKACGVTFPASMLERVVEERVAGDPGAAAALRRSLGDLVGANLAAVVPGSPQAAEVKRALVAHGMWSQYLEVGIGPHAEVFTKAPVLSAVGTGARVGVRAESEWNNPEPEVVLLVDQANRLVGATLGNDVNLRDFEGRSALLLGEAKDNNASCSVGPWIRLFDAGFTLERLLSTDVRVEIRGTDGFSLDQSYPLSALARDPYDLVQQVGGRTHQYPDGYALFLGTGFAPTDDRSGPGEGFTHRVGDLVRISNPLLGALVNWVGHSEELPPWTAGIRSLWRSLGALPPV
ncbi:fumarylacetoacetate hydrolase family protein [Geodermatophilus sp. SYSU D01186]